MNTYFLHDPRRNLLKIGRSTNVQKRVAGIRTASGANCKLLGTLDGDLESEWHRRFASERKLGEWFEVTPSMAELLRSTFGWRIKAARNDEPQTPHPHAGLRDRLDDITGAALRSPELEALSDFVADQGWRRFDEELEGLLDAEEEPLSSEDLAEFKDELREENDHDWNAIHTLADEHAEWWMGWATNQRGPWIDLWLAFWRPSPHRLTLRLAEDAIEAFVATDDGVWNLSVLVVGDDGKITELPNERLWSKTA